MKKYLFLFSFLEFFAVLDKVSINDTIMKHFNSKAQVSKLIIQKIS